MADYRQMLADVINHGALALSLAMAQETGVVHVLCHADTPLTSYEVAQRAGLKERYVRELLGSLVAGRVVQLSPGTGGREGPEACYIVPQHERSVLTVMAQKSTLLSISCRQFEEVKGIFAVDGPSCIRFHESLFSLSDCMGSSRAPVIFKFFFNIPGLRQKLEGGINVGEIGCGTGWMSRKLAAMFPRSRFTVTDVVQVALDKAKQQAAAEGLTNITFRIVDACDPPDDWKEEQFDWMYTVNVIHDLPHPQKGVECVRKVLRPGGIFSMVDVCFSSYLAENVGDDNAAFYYQRSAFHCVPESYQQPDSEALGACWGEDLARKTVEGAGLKLLEVSRSEELGAFAVFTCMKPA